MVNTTVCGALREAIVQLRSKRRRRAAIADAFRRRRAPLWIRSHRELQGDRRGALAAAHPSPETHGSAANHPSRRCRIGFTGHLLT